MKDKLLGTREVSHILGISEKEIIELAKTHAIPHFRVAGEFMRFKKEDIVRLRPVIKKQYNIPEQQSHRLERLREFFYFNDFYLFSTLLILLLLWIIIKDVAFSF